MAKYKEIVLRLSRFNLNFQKDAKATEILSSILIECDNSVSWDYVKSILCRKTHSCIVSGAGPSLEESEDIFKRKNSLIVAADGATSYLLEINIQPDIIVTDLDGRIEDIIKASEDAFVFVHAHGDNISKIVKYTPRLQNVIGTTQTYPKPRVYNFGGFTDGDRSVFISCALGIKNMLLVGMDFGDVVGRYSKPYLRSNIPADPIKKEKLEIAAELINFCKAYYNASIKFARV